MFRWEEGLGRSYSTQQIIEAAEASCAIRELTLWTLKRAISDQLVLIDNGLDVTLDVNMSGRLLSESEFTLQAIEIIKSAPGRIGIEITETAVIEHPVRALANLELYASAGAPIAIDDYGMGLSSLSYLKRIPAQELKIDREYIKDLTHSNRDPMIVRSTIDLAHALDLKVTAEGVDDPMKLAAALGGRIETESEVNRGSTFRLVLSVTSDEREANEGAQRPIAFDQSRMGLIEANTMKQAILMGLIEPHAKSVAPFADPQSCADAMARGQIDHIVLDAASAAGNGAPVDGLRRLLDQAKEVGIATTVLFAATDDLPVEAVTQMPYTHLLLKPVSGDALIACLRDHYAKLSEAGGEMTYASAA